MRFLCTYFWQNFGFWAILSFFFRHSSFHSYFHGFFFGGGGGGVYPATKSFSADLLPVTLNSHVSVLLYILLKKALLVLQIFARICMSDFCKQRENLNSISLPRYNCFLRLKNIFIQRVLHYCVKSGDHQWESTLFKLFFFCFSNPGLTSAWNCVFCLLSFSLSGVLAFWPSLGSSNVPSGFKQLPTSVVSNNFSLKPDSHSRLYCVGSLRLRPWGGFFFGITLLTKLAEGLGRKAVGL